MDTMSEDERRKTKDRADGGETMNRTAAAPERNNKIRNGQGLCLDEQTLRWCGVQIRRHRLQKEWSQESVCRGICAVSTLSKIESGAAVGSLEMLELLAHRLGFVLPLLSEEEKAQEEALYGLLQAGRFEEAAEKIEALHEKRVKEGQSESLLLVLMRAVVCQEKPGDGLEEAAGWMENRLQAMRAFARQDYEQAARLLPEAWMQMHCSWNLYIQGRPETEVLQLAQQAYEEASCTGEVYLMAVISHCQGVVCSNLPDSSQALPYFERARKILGALEDKGSLLNDLEYNTGALLLERGQFEEAAACFQAMKQKESFMPLLKLAVCYEQSGQPDRAAAVLERAVQAEADGWSDTLRQLMTETLRLRLERPDWLHDREYAEKLMTLFDALRNEDLHHGYAQFYLPWVVQVLKASRQYARLVQILENFPGKPLFVPLEPPKQV